MIRVLIVDDQALFRGGIRMLVESQPDLVCVGEAADGAQAVRLAEEQQPDVVLMDVRMPVLDGISATDRIVRANPARSTRASRRVSSVSTRTSPVRPGCLRASSKARAICFSRRPYWARSRCFSRRRTA